MYSFALRKDEFCDEYNRNVLVLSAAWQFRSSKERGKI